MSLALLLGATLAGCDRLQTWLHPARCALSSRPIHAGMGVRIRIDANPPVWACCLRCTIVDSEHTGRTIHVRSVTDYVSHDEVAPRDAFYLVGSGIKPCAAPPVAVSASRRESAEQTWDRCLPSIIAFARRADAEQVQAAEGGTIASFDDLVAGTRVVADAGPPDPES